MSYTDPFGYNPSQSTDAFGYDPSQPAPDADPTNNVGANANTSPADTGRADTGSFADAQYGSDFQTPAERTQDDSSWDVTSDVGSNKRQASPDYSGMDNSPDPTNSVGSNADSGSFADAGGTGTDTGLGDQRQQPQGYPDYISPQTYNDWEGGDTAPDDLPFPNAVPPTPTPDPTNLSGSKSTGYPDYVRPQTYNDWEGGDTAPDDLPFPNAAWADIQRGIVESNPSYPENVVEPGHVTGKNDRGDTTMAGRPPTHEVPNAQYPQQTYSDTTAPPTNDGYDQSGWDQQQIRGTGLPHADWVQGSTLDYTPTYDSTSAPDQAAFADAGGTGTSTGLPGTPDDPQQSSYQYTPGVDIPSDSLDSTGQAASDYYSNPTPQTQDAYRQQLAQASDAAAADEGNLTQAANDQIAQQQTNYENSPSYDYVNLQQAAGQPMADLGAALANGDTSFTTPSGQTVTRTDDGSGYGSWTIAGADDPNNVLYKGDDGTWQAIPRDQATQLMQQGATADQFTSVANAPSIAGQAIQSTGTTPQTPGFEQRALQSVGMIAAAPLAATAADAILPTLADVAVNPATLAKAIPAAYALKGTGDTLGTTGIVGQFLELASNLPGVGQYAQDAKNFKVPDTLQNPLAVIEQVGEGVKQQIGQGNFGAVTPAGIATIAFNTMLADAPQKDPLGFVKGFYTEDPVRFAEQSGLQRAGVENLLTNTVSIHRDGLLPTLSAADPVARFHAVFQDELAKNGGDPQAAANAAFDRTNNAVAEFLHTYDLLNPLWFAIETPGLEQVLGDVFHAVGTPLAKVPGVAAVGDVFTQLSAKSGADLATRDLSAQLATMVGRTDGVPDALGDLLTIGRTFRTESVDTARTMASDYAMTYGTTPDAALSFGNRLYGGVEAGIVARNAAGTAVDAQGEVGRLIDMLAQRAFTPDARAAAIRGYGLARVSDAAAVDAQTALDTARSLIRNAEYTRAGVDLRALSDPSALSRTISFAADTLRTMYLMPGAVALSVKKIGDEALRGWTQGVAGDFAGLAGRAADMSTTRALARNLEGRGGTLGRIGAGIEDRSTVRQYLERGIPLGPELARTPVSTRAAFSPFRATDKVLDALVSSPTQHVRINAAYRDLTNWDAAKPQMADNFARNVIAAFGDLPVDRQALYQEAHGAVMAARSPQEIADLANHYAVQGAQIAPDARVPSSAGQSRYTPSARVTEAMHATGGEQGLVGAAGTPVRPGGAADRMPLPREIAPEKYGRNVGSAGAGMGQPLRGGDIAAGDGGAGYLSGTQRAVRDDVNAMGGFGTGTTRGAIPSNRPGSRLMAPLPTSEGDVARYVADVQNRLASIAPESQTRAINELRAELHRMQTPQAARSLRALTENGIRDPARIAADAARSAPPFNAGEAIKARLDELGIAPTGGLPAPRQIGSDARFTPTQPEEQVLGRAAQAAQGDVTAQVGSAAQGDVTAAVGARASGTRLLGPGATPLDRLMLPEGARFPHFTAGPDGVTPGKALVDVPFADAGALRQGYERAASVGRSFAPEFGQRQAAQTMAGTARGNAIIGDFARQTRFGELASQGSINGRQVFAPLVPFAPFHIHTTQFWAEYFLQHPAVPFAIARTLAGINPDQYGALTIGGRRVDGLLELSTAAKLVEWARQLYGYSMDAIRNPNGNNPLQTAAKIAGQAIFGNDAFIRPFDYIGTPAQAAVQSATNPLTKGKDFATGQPKIDPREAIRGSVSGNPLGAAVNLALGKAGVNVPRNVVGTATNPAQAITNWTREQAVRGVNALGGHAQYQDPTDANTVAYFLGDYAKTHNLDPKAVAKAYYSPSTPADLALKTQLTQAYNQSQDTANLQKFSPVRVGDEATGAKGIFAPANFSPTETAAYYRSLDYQQRAGEGGKDAGTGIPAGSYINKTGKNAGEPNPYYIQSPEEGRTSTAMAQIAKSTPITPDSVPFADYNRDYLGRSDVQAAATAGQQKAIPGEIAGNASRTGAGLPQDQRVAQIAKEQQLGQVIGRNADGSAFTLSNLLDQSGVTGPNGIEAKLHGMPAGPEKTAREGQLAAIKAELARTSPAAAAYLGQQDAAFTASSPSGQFYAGLPQPQKDAYDAFNDLRNSADYKRYDALIAAENAAGPFGSPAEKAWYTANKDELNRLKGVIGAAEQSIVTRFGVNPRELANQAAIAAGRPAPYANTALTAPSGTTTSTSSARTSTYTPSSKKPFVPYTAAQKAAYGRSLGSSSSSRTASSSGAASAGNDFFNFYRGLTDKAEKAAVLSALDKANVNPIGQKGVTAQTFSQALTVARDALYTKRAEAAMNGTRLAAGQGMTRAQAEYAIGQLERQAGIRSSAPVSAPALAPASAPKRTTTAYAYPGKKKVA